MLLCISVCCYAVVCVACFDIQEVNLENYAVLLEIHFRVSLFYHYHADTLPFLDLGDDPFLFTGVLDGYRNITFPSTIYFNNESYNDAYVC